jgi:hypothetical protein
MSRLLRFQIAGKQKEKNISIKVSMFFSLSAMCSRYYNLFATGGKGRPHLFFPASHSPVLIVLSRHCGGKAGRSFIE